MSPSLSAWLSVCLCCCFDRVYFFIRHYTTRVKKLHYVIFAITRVGMLRFTRHYKDTFYSRDIGDFDIFLLSNSLEYKCAKIMIIELSLTKLLQK